LITIATRNGLVNPRNATSARYVQKPLPANFVTVSQPIILFRWYLHPENVITGEIFVSENEKISYCGGRLQQATKRNLHGNYAGDAILDG
jgi:hypothetical protein